MRFLTVLWLFCECCVRVLWVFCECFPSVLQRQFQRKLTIPSLPTGCIRGPRKVFWVATYRPALTILLFSPVPSRFLQQILLSLAGSLAGSLAADSSFSRRQPGRQSRSRFFFFSPAVSLAVSPAVSQQILLSLAGSLAGNLARHRLARLTRKRLERRSFLKSLWVSLPNLFCESRGYGGFWLA